MLRSNPWTSAPGPVVPTGTINAASLSDADVATALALASPGNTVVLPAGSATWSTDKTVPAGVHMKGAGGGWIQGSSSSSVSIGSASGTRSFTIRSSAKLPGGSSAIFGFTVGEAVIARVKYNASQYITGTVNSWDGTTLVISVSAVAGSGTYGRWVFQQVGATHITRSGGTISMPSHAAYKTVVSDIDFTNATASGNQMFVLQGTLDHAFVELSRVQVTCSTQFGGGNSRMAWCYSRGTLITRCSFALTGFNWGVVYPSPSYGIGMFSLGYTAPSNSWASGPTYGTDDTNGRKNSYIEDCYIFGGHTENYDFYNGARVVMRGCVQDNATGTSHGIDSAIESLRQMEIYNCLWIYEDNGNNNNTASCDSFFYHRGGSGIWTDCETDNITSGQWGDKTEWGYTINDLRRNIGPYACYTSYPVPQQIGWGCNGSGVDTLEGLYYWNLTGAITAPVPRDFNPNECGGDNTTAAWVVEGRDKFGSAKSGYTKYTYPHPQRIT